MSKKDIWFRAKLYGWGWNPVTWQGWVLTILYGLGLTGYVRQSDFASHSASDTLLQFAVPFLAITVLFLAICYLKGEKPKWRWGK